MSISSRYTLLIVDRNKERLRRVVSHFDRSRFKLLAAVTGQGGLRLARKHCPDVIFIGPVLEDGLGLDLHVLFDGEPAAGRSLVFLLDDESPHGALAGPDDAMIEHAFISSFDSELESLILRLLQSTPRR